VSGRKPSKVRGNSFVAWKLHPQLSRSPSIRTAQTVRYADYELKIDPGEIMRMRAKNAHITSWLTGAALALLAPALALAADAPPVPSKGDTAWMLTSTAFVLLMSVPALGLFYGGLVRTKNMLSVLMQVFVGFSLITVLWCIYGYSLAFTPGNAFIGGFSRLFLSGTFDPATGTFALAGTFSKNTPM
jgi:hypothetical protein